MWTNYNIFDVTRLDEQIHNLQDLGYELVSQPEGFFYFYNITTNNPAVIILHGDEIIISTHFVKIKRKEF